MQQHNGISQGQHVRKSEATKKKIVNDIKEDCNGNDKKLKRIKKSF